MYIYYKFKNCPKRHIIQMLSLLHVKKKISLTVNQNIDGPIQELWVEGVTTELQNFIELPRIKK